MRTATALAARADAPAAVVLTALLHCAADHTTPLASWAALQALRRHPTADAKAILPVLFRAPLHSEIHRAAAEAILAGDPTLGLRVCIEAAELPGVQWVLADVTGAAIDPGADAWLPWWLTELPKHTWAPERWMFEPIRSP